MTTRPQPRRPTEAHALDRLVPNDPAAEAAVVAACMVDIDGVARVRGIVRPDDFFHQLYGWIYAAELACADRGEPVDVITVGHELSRRGQLDQVGGHAALSELTIDLPTAVGVEWHARLVRNDATHRQLISLSGKIANAAYAGGRDAERLVDVVIAQLDALRTTQAQQAPNEGAPILVALSDVVAREPSWLWEPYVPLGAVTSLEGDPGQGKSTLSSALAAAISVGAGIAGGPSVATGRTLLLSKEDDPARVLRPRLDAMGADVQQIVQLAGILRGGSESPLMLDIEGITALERAMEQLRPALVVIDPLIEHIAGGVDIYRANEVRAIMRPLAGLAQRFESAILIVRHLTKGQRDALHRGQGSVDFTAAVRSQLLVARDPRDPSRQLMAQTKNSLGPLAPAVVFTLDGGFAWGGTVRIDPEELATPAAERNLQREATNFLRELLGPGPLPANHVLREAREAGINPVTVRRAREALNIKPERVSALESQRGRGYWRWELPPDPSHEQAETGTAVQGDHDDHLVNQTPETVAAVQGDHVDHLEAGPLFKVIKADDHLERGADQGDHDHLEHDHLDHASEAPETFKVINQGDHAPTTHDHLDHLDHLERGAGIGRSDVQDDQALHTLRAGASAGACARSDSTPTGTVGAPATCPRCGNEPDAFTCLYCDETLCAVCGALTGSATAARCELHDRCYWCKVPAPAGRQFGPRWVGPECFGREAE